MALTTPAILVEASFRPDALASYLSSIWTGVSGDNLFVDMSNVADYAIVPGDYLEFDVRWPSLGINVASGFYLRYSDGTYGSDLFDQNSDSLGVGTDLRARFGAASGGWYPWYHRSAPLTAGKTIAKYLLGSIPATTMTNVDVRLRNIVITDGAGQVKFVIWAQGDGPPSLFADVSVGSEALVVSRGVEKRVWANIAPFVLSLNPSHGRQTETDQVEAGTMSLKVADDVRNFDADNPGVLTNLLTNPSFESGATSWTAVGGTIARSTVRAYVGAASGLFTVSANGAQYAIPGGDVGALRNGMLPSHTYTFSAYVYVPSGSGSTWSLRIFDNDGSGYQSSASAVVTTFDTWVRLVVTRTIRPGATEAFLRLGNDSALAGQTVYIDGVQLEESAVVTTYCDGDQESCRWVSAAHASQSYRGGPWYGYLDNGAPIRARVVYPANLVSDPSFEANAIPLDSTLAADDAGRLTNPGGWYASVTGTGPVSIVPETTSPQDGTYRAKATLTTSGDMATLVSDLIPIPNDRPLVLSFYANKVSGSINPQMNVGVRFYDGLGREITAILPPVAGQQLTAATGLTALSSNQNPGGSWTRYGGVLTPDLIPGATSHMRITVSFAIAAAGPVAVALDAFQLELAELIGGAYAAQPYATPIVDGLFTGEIQRLPPGFGQRHADVEIECTDGTERLSRGTIPAKFYGQDFSGNQIAAILADIGWGTLTAIEQGSATVQSWTADENSGIDRIQEVASAELGLYFADGNGVATFHGRSHRITPPNNLSLGIFSTAPGSGEYQALAPAPSRDVDRVVNHAARRPAGGITWYTADDIVSRRKYGLRTSEEEPVIVTTSEALNQSLLLVSRYAYPIVRFDSITLEPFRAASARALGSSQGDLWPQIIQREISDRITVKWTPPGYGPTMVKDCYIESVAHTIELDRGMSAIHWQVVWALSPADTSNYWIVGDATNGLLGQTTRVGY